MEKVYKGLKIFFVIFAILSLSLALTSGIWVYQNPASELGVVAQNSSEVLSEEDLEIVSVDNIDDLEGVEYNNELTEITSADDLRRLQQDESTPVYLRGQLVVPSLGITQEIYEGTSDRALSLGAGTVNPNSSPDKIGNYALSAHNFAHYSHAQGFSNLQAYKGDLTGRYAYVSDDEYIYTYLLVEEYDVPGRGSMKYTDHDWQNRNFSEYNEEYSIETVEVSGSDAIGNTSDSYRDADPNETYTYGRLLTLYTCDLLPPDYIQYYDRIITTGVQIEQTPIDQASPELQQHFIAGYENDYNLEVSELASDTEEEITDTQEGSVEIREHEEARDSGEFSDHHTILDRLFRPLMEKFGPQAVKTLSTVSNISFIISVILIFFFSWLEGKELKKKEPSHVENDSTKQTETYNDIDEWFNS